jgi:bifunctional non-homologous end joining protein LigD
MQTMIEMNKHKIPVKNLDKIFWPDDGFTKADIIKYYAQVWPYLAPHLVNRPVSLVRYPEGITGDFFYQKDVPEPPPWAETILVGSGEREVNYALINNLETLIWSVNLGCIEVHPWLSRTEALDYPSYIIFDLDPMPPATFDDVVKIAAFIKVMMDQYKLKVFPKVSGATGIHIYLPIMPRYGYQETSAFVKQIGAFIVKTFPQLATNERKISNRSGKVYIDHLQNLKGKTIASVYSIRPFPLAPVSMPVQWEELPDCHPAMFTIKTALTRLAKKGDLFKPLLYTAQELPDLTPTSTTRPLP